MSATDALQRGDLTQALADLKDQIRSKPDDSSSRVFLFQLLCVNGQWDKAKTQLDLCGQLDPAAELMVTAYTSTLQCERLRGEIFAGRRTPLVLGQPEPWVAWMIQALALRSEGKHAAAEELREKAFEEAPATSGTIEFRVSGKGNQEQTETAPFEWIADADTTLGPIMEVYLDGRYFWAPISHIESIRIEPPTDLRDMVWLPVQFTWLGGGQQLGFMPTRYVGSESSDNDAVRLARQTDWVDGGGFECGRGQRLFGTDQSEYGLLDIRSIGFDVSEVEGDPIDAEVDEDHG